MPKARAATLRIEDLMPSWHYRRAVMVGLERGSRFDSGGQALDFFTLVAARPNEIEVVHRKIQYIVEN